MDAKLFQAINIIRNGGVVAFPTETVYGLGADATNESAVQKIFQLKKRPNFNPLIVHVANIAQVESIAIVSDDAYRLLQQFSPGPLTIVAQLKHGHNIAKSVLAGLDTIAIRIPNHKIAQELIKLSECPIAAPSANLSGYISATKAEHVSTHFAYAIASSELFVVEEEQTSVIGLESTIIDTTTACPTILRYGFITPDNIAKLLNKQVAISSSLSAIKAPGMLKKHYSPNARLRLNATNLVSNEIGLNFGNSNLVGEFSLNLSEQASLIEAASNLYDMLRILDNYANINKIAQIAVTLIPNDNIGLAINDRLTRATAT